MTTLISQTSDKSYTLIVDGYTVEVYVGSSYLNVYAGKARLGHGRPFTKTEPKPGCWPPSSPTKLLR
jgi:hypothetical protein